ncbi:MAG: IclR family transcriptional regulator [Desulfomonilaceae bacterium]
MEMNLETAPLTFTEFDHRAPNGRGFKRVPALDKCFAILDLTTSSERDLGLSEISNRLHLHKSTVSNIIRTLTELEILERRPNGKLSLGTHLYVLGKASGSKAQLVRTVRPYLEEISCKSVFSSFLGVRWGLNAVIVDKVETAADIKVSYEIGMRLPLLVGAAGKALLCQLSDVDLDKILSENEPLKLAANFDEDKARLRDAVIRVREEGIADDMEERIKDVIALAVPINTHKTDLQAAILVAGLKWQWRGGRMFTLSKMMKEIAAQLDCRFCNS